jgi:hypothetical protein
MPQAFAAEMVGGVDAGLDGDGLTARGEADAEVVADAPAAPDAEQPAAIITAATAAASSGVRDRLRTGALSRSDPVRGNRDPRPPPRAPAPIRLGVG